MVNKIHYWCVGLSCLIVLSKAPYAVSAETIRENSFDFGPLRCCARPRDSEVCPNLSDRIPCTLATNMTAIEERILYELTIFGKFSSVYSTCSEGIRDILCKARFPTCVITANGTHQIQLPPRDTCKTKLDSCPTFLQSNDNIDDMCFLYDSTNTTYSVANCNAHNMTGLSHCTVDWYLPEWLRRFVRKIDEDLGRSRNVDLLSVNTSCWEKIRDFQCQSVGRCWAQGDRLEYINSRETCNEVMRW